MTGENSRGKASYLPGDNPRVERSVLYMDSRRQREEINGFHVTYRRTAKLVEGRRRPYEEIDLKEENVERLSYLVGMLEEESEGIIDPGARKAIMPATRNWGSLTDMLISEGEETKVDQAIAYQVLEGISQEDITAEKNGITLAPEKMFRRLQEHFGAVDCDDIERAYERVVESEEEFYRKARRDLLRIKSDEDLYSHVEGTARGKLDQYFQGISGICSKIIDGVGKSYTTPGKLREYEEAAFGRELEDYERAKIGSDIFEEVSKLEIGSSDREKLQPLNVSPLKQRGSELELFRIGANRGSLSRQLAESIMDNAWRKKLEEIEENPDEDFEEYLEGEIDSDEARRLGYQEEAVDHIRDLLTEDDS